MVGGCGHASASNRTGRARMEWNSQREVRVWGRNGKASRSDAFQMYLRRRHAAVPMFILRQWWIKVREVLP